MKNKLTALLISSLCVICLVSISLFYISSIEKNEEYEESYVSGVLAKVSSEEMTEQASLIVSGKFTGSSNTLRVRSTENQMEQNFTDLGFEVDSVMRGMADIGEEITIRVDGGVAGKYIEYFEATPNFQEGDEYILFLYNPGENYILNTEGEHYFIVGVNQGAFKLLENSEVSTLNISSENSFQKFYGGLSVNSENSTLMTVNSVSITDPYNTVIAKDDFKTQMEQYNLSNPINEDYTREKELENAKENLESGFITQSEYDELVNKIPKYAEIIIE